MSIRLFGCVCGQFHSPGAALGMAAETAHTFGYHAPA